MSNEEKNKISEENIRFLNAAGEIARVEAAEGLVITIVLFGLFVTFSLIALVVAIEYSFRTGDALPVAFFSFFLLVFGYMLWGYVRRYRILKSSGLIDISKDE